MESDLKHWTTLICSAARRGSYRQTLQLFSQVLQANLKPNRYVIPNAVIACANLRDLKTGCQLHAFFLRSCSYLDSFVNTSLIVFYCKCGRIRAARNIFDRMLDRDLIAWNSMISGYAQQGFMEEALLLAARLREVGLRPDRVTWNELIAGFSLAGEDLIALNLFEEMRVDGYMPDIISWTSLISGLVKNFRYCKAFDAFRRMVCLGLHPSSVTVSCILPGCANTSNSKLGKQIHGYAVLTGIEGDTQVSSSLIDMYAKCGLIIDAEVLFDNMNSKNVITYNAMIFGYANNGYCGKAICLFQQMVHDPSSQPDHLTFMAAITACGHAGWVDVGQRLFRLMQKGYGIQPRLENYACMIDLLGQAGKVTEAYNFIKEMPVKPDSFAWGALLGACRSHGDIELARQAALALFELEAKSAGGALLLSNLFASSGKWEDAIKYKKMAKRRRLEKSVGCSWVEET